MNIEGLSAGWKRVIEYLIYIFVALFPFVIYQKFLYFGTATRSINLMFVVELVALIIGFSLFKKRTILSVSRSPITLTLGALLIVMSISSFVGLDFSTSFWSKITRTTGLFYFLHLALLYLVLFFILQEEKMQRRFVGIFLISAGVFSVGAIFGSNTWGGFTFINSTFAAMYLYAAFMLSFYYLALGTAGARKWWYYLIPFVFIINPYILNSAIWNGEINIFKNLLGAIGSAQTTSYVLILSVFALVIAWLFSKMKNHTVKKVSFFVSVALGLFFAIFASFSLLSTSGYLQKIYLSQSNSARPIVWEIAKQGVAERPVLGWGVDNFSYVFEKYYDSRLLEIKNGGEGWFDRAHNIFLDQTVETGYLGLVFYLLVYFAIFGCLIYVLFRSRQSHRRRLAVILMIYFVGHVIELQTAFDTSISYLPLLIMTTIASTLFSQVIRENGQSKMEFVVPNFARYAAGLMFIGLFGYLFMFGLWPFVRAQSANGLMRTVGVTEKRLPLYPVIFSTPIDRSAFLWYSSYDLQRGILSTPALVNDKIKKAGFVKEFELFVAEYEKYNLTHPNEYRMKIQLAETYIYQRLFDVDNLDKAHQVLDEAISISPNAPQAYWMKAVAYLYQRKFVQAESLAQQAHKLNPDVEESQRILRYINESVKTFPEIDLYAFRQM